MINPQNGHILCDRTWLLSVVRMSRSFRNQAAIEDNGLGTLTGTCYFRSLEKAIKNLSEGGLWLLSLDRASRILLTSCLGASQDSQPGQYDRTHNDPLGRHVQHHSGVDESANHD